MSPLTTTAGRDRPSPLRRGRDAAGLIGDLQTAALVTTDGPVDWFCVPRFDSPSVLGALLDDERGGHFRIRPVDVAYTSKQRYFPDTAVLVTRFFTEDGLGQVVDFMPPRTCSCPTADRADVDDAGRGRRFHLGQHRAHKRPSGPPDRFICLRGCRRPWPGARAPR